MGLQQSIHAVIFLFACMTGVVRGTFPTTFIRNELVYLRSNT
jgi:hypothetical protein